MSCVILRLPLTLESIGVMLNSPWAKDVTPLDLMG